MGYDVFDAQQRFLVKRSGVEQVYGLLSRTFELEGYLLVYFENFSKIQEEYSRLCYRKLRFRRYSVAQRAYDSVVNEVVCDLPPAAIPKKKDGDRKKQRRKHRQDRQKENRNGRQDSLTSTSVSSKPPVIACGNGFCAHSKSHPPLPIRSLIYRLSRHCLVGIAPEFTQQS